MEQDWIERVILAMDGTVRINHQANHADIKVTYEACILGTCGAMNPLILQAQQQGFGLRGIAWRR